MPVCYLALGGNLGDVAATFESALRRLPARGIDVITRSRLYTTTPVGAQVGGEFLNAAAEVTTNLAPREVLAALQAVESELGRTRTVHWGPRPIDLDLIYYGNEQVALPNLVVPHPAAWYRRFVLDPLAEIAPQSFHPVFRLRTEPLRRRLLQRPLAMTVETERPAIAELLKRRIDAIGDRVRRIDTAARAMIVFRYRDETLPLDDAALPQVIDIASAATAEQQVRDVLAAALDEPRAVPE